MHNIAFRNQSNMADWIFPNGTLVHVDNIDEAPEIIAIGVEELVDLNASNLVKASTTNQRLWTEGIRRVLHEHGSYILLVVEQLVGVCLFIFARPHLAPFIKDFAVSSVKTGMGGATGNKGSVAFRMVVHSTSFCFVCSHFAAGQNEVGVCLFIFARPHLAPFIKDFAVSSVKTGMGGATGNKGSVAFRMVVHSTSFCFVCSHFAAGQNEVKDRNEDFSSALRRIKFPQGREIESHDVVFWFGDFNYRFDNS
ncbi:hypothetical protein OESDEN_15421, partial [Oesophagostomum dentatum]